MIKRLVFYAALVAISLLVVLPVSAQDQDEESDVLKRVSITETESVVAYEDGRFAFESPSSKLWLPANCEVMPTKLMSAHEVEVERARRLVVIYNTCIVAYDPSKGFGGDPVLSTSDTNVLAVSVPVYYHQGVGRAVAQTVSVNKSPANNDVIVQLSTAMVGLTAGSVDFYGPEYPWDYSALAKLTSDMTKLPTGRVPDTLKELEPGMAKVSYDAEVGTITATLSEVTRVTIEHPAGELILSVDSQPTYAILLSEVGVTVVQRHKTYVTTFEQINTGRIPDVYHISPLQIWGIGNEEETRVDCLGALVMDPSGPFEFTIRTTVIKAPQTECQVNQITVMQEHYTAAAEAYAATRTKTQRVLVLDLGSGERLDGKYVYRLQVEKSGIPTVLELRFEEERWNVYPVNNQGVAEQRPVNYFPGNHIGMGFKWHENKGQYSISPLN